MKDRKLVPCGAVPIPAPIASQEATRIPTGFPTTSPKAVPTKTRMSVAESRLMERLTPTAENANKDKKTYAVQGSIVRWIRSAGNSKRALTAKRLRPERSSQMVSIRKEQRSTELGPVTEPGRRGPQNDHRHVSDTRRSCDSCGAR